LAQKDHGLAATIAALGIETPWYVTRFHPSRLTELPKTPVSTLRRIRFLGRQAGLRYVYCGNIPGAESENTCCRRCGAVLIKRRGYRIDVARLGNGRGAKCGSQIDGAGLP
jgi:pyruvate formate lyase activating enzyme